MRQTMATTLAFRSHSSIAPSCTQLPRQSCFMDHSRNSRAQRTCFSNKEVLRARLLCSGPPGTSLVSCAFKSRAIRLRPRNIRRKSQCDSTSLTVLRKTSIARSPLRSSRPPSTTNISSGCFVDTSRTRSTRTIPSHTWQKTRQSCIGPSSHSKQTLDSASARCLKRLIRHGHCWNQSKTSSGPSSDLFLKQLFPTDRATIWCSMARVSQTI
jgi:hypothetical protein